MFFWESIENKETKLAEKVSMVVTFPILGERVINKSEKSWKE